MTKSLSCLEVMGEIDLRLLGKTPRYFAVVFVVAVSLCCCVLFLSESPKKNEAVWQDIVAMQSASSYAEANVFMDSLEAAGEEAIPALIECLHETYGNELYVRESLRVIGEPAIEPLISFVERGDLSKYPLIWDNWSHLPAFVRYRFRNPGNERQLQKIVVALSVEIGPDDRRVYDFLLRLSRHHYEFSRLTAFQAMGDLDDRFASEIFARLSVSVEDPSKFVRAAVASTLAAIPVQPDDSIPLLLKLMDDPDDYVRRSAAATLGSLDGKRPVKYRGVKKLSNDWTLRKNRGERPRG